MELRVLRYYLTICREGTMSKAAELLHLTQPTLSRQIADLERELGCVLLERHSRSVVPTEKGLYLRRRAEEIVALADQTVADFALNDEIIEGDVYIGAGESQGLSLIAARIRAFRERYPHVRFHLHSGNSIDVLERLEHGSADFAVLMSYPEINRYEHIRLAATDQWGVLVPADSPLATRAAITPHDVTSLPIIISEQALENGSLAHWFGDQLPSLDIAATYNLFFNAVRLAHEGVGYVFCLDKLAHTGEETGLVFRPLEPPVISHIDFAWKRHQVFTNAAQKFLECMKEDGWQ